MNRKEKEQREGIAKVIQIILYIWFPAVLIPIHVVKKSLLPPLGCVLLFVIWAAGIPTLMFIHNRMMESPGKNKQQMNLNKVLHKTMAGLFCGSILALIIVVFLIKELPWYIILIIVVAAIAVGAVSFIVGLKLQNKIEAEEKDKTNNG